MTMIIAINLGKYVIVAADKRKSYIKNNHVTCVLSDETKKLTEWNGGVLTGSGYFPLLSEVVENIRSKTIKSTHEITDATKKFSDKLPANLNAWKSLTNFVFTYDTCESGQYKTRVAHIKASAPEQLSILEDNRVLILAKIPNYCSCTNYLQSKLKPPKTTEEIKKNIKYHLSILDKFFKYVSSVNASVSQKFDFYIHFPEDRTLGYRV